MKDACAEDTGISFNIDGAGATGFGRCEVERSCAIDYAIRRAVNEDGGGLFMYY